MTGALCHGLCVGGVGVHKHLVSVNYRTNAFVDWSNFSVAYWGWLEEGSFRWSAPPLIQDGRYAHHLGFGLHWFSDQRLGRLVWFFGGSLGVTRGRFLTVTAHLTWPLRQPSWIWFPSIIWRTPVDLYDFLVPHWGSSIFTMFHFSVHTPTDNVPIGGICHALRCPCLSCGGRRWAGVFHIDISVLNKIFWSEYRSNIFWSLEGRPVDCCSSLFTSATDVSLNSLLCLSTIAVEVITRHPNWKRWSDHLTSSLCDLRHPSSEKRTSIPFGKSGQGIRGLLHPQPVTAVWTQNLQWL
jgi:hypothetical protein